MRNRITKLIFPFIAILLLAPWPIAYAYSYEGEMASQGVVQVKAADASVAPSAIAFGRSVGSVTPGDLFYIDAIDKWDAQIKINYKKHRLGQFKSKLKAVSARWEAEKKYKFPDCSTKSTAYLYLKERNVA